MICPNCGAEATDSLNFCEICGLPLPAGTAQQAAEGAGGAPAGAEGQAAQPQQPGAQQGQPTAQQPVPPATPVQPNQQYQQYQQPGQPVPPTGYQAPGTPQPSSAPFVLAILALVTAVFGLFPISLIFAIIALVLNSGQKKRNEFSTKQTPTTVMGIIGLVLSIIELVFTIVIFALAYSAVMQAIDSGKIDMNEIIEYAQSGPGSNDSDFWSRPAGSSSSASSSSTSSVVAIEGDLVGSWKLTMVVASGESDDSVDFSNFGKSSDYTVTLEMGADHGALIDLNGEQHKGLWEVESDGNVVLMLGDAPLEGDLLGDELSLANNHESLTFERE